MPWFNFPLELGALEMSKICCIEDVEKSPKASSCSMTLRSACSHHKPSPESLTVVQIPRFRASFRSEHCPELSIEGSFNQSVPIKHFQEFLSEEAVAESPKNTYSLLKDYLNTTYGLCGNVSLKVIKTSTTVSSTKQQNVDDSLTSASSVFDFLSPREKCSKYSRPAKSKMISSKVSNSTSSMTRTSIRRSTLSSVRSLSGSEGEDDIFIERITRGRKRTPDTNSNYAASKSTMLSEASYNGQQLSASNSQAVFASKNCSLTSHRCSSECSHHSCITDMSELERCQSTLVGTVRWYLWRYMYLMMIRYVNLDVWLLSWLHSFGKRKVASYILLLLLLPIVWGFLSRDELSFTGISQTLYPMMSAVYTIFFSFFSSVLQSLSVFSWKSQEISQPLEHNPIYDSEIILPYYSDSPKVPLSASSQELVGLKSNEASLNSDEEEIKFETSKKGAKISEVHLSADDLRVLVSDMLRKEVHVFSELQRAEKEEEKSKWMSQVEKEQSLRDEMMNLRAEFQSLSKSVEQRLKSITVDLDQKSQEADEIMSQASDYKKDINKLSLKLDALGAKISLLDELKSCCDNQLSENDVLALLNSNLIAAFKNVVDADANPSSNYYFFTQWMNRKFFTRESLVPEINAALKKHSAHQNAERDPELIIKVVESTVFKYVESIKENVTRNFGSSAQAFSQDFFSEDRVRKIIKEAIMLYDADKTGQVDYALESGGASVIGTRCTETYHEMYGKISLFGVPLWTYSNSPRTAIQPDMQPGRCWGFKGSVGYLVVSLSATIYPTGFTIEHIPLSISPSGTIDSAPEKFSVWGLNHEKDDKGILFGEYIYDIKAEPLQYFEVQNLPEKPYSFIELKIHNNHGNMEYTCLYRFRVHGHL